MTSSKPVRLLTPDEAAQFLSVSHVRRQSFSEWRGVFVMEALVRFLFEFMRQRLGAASGVFGLSVS